MIGCVADSEEHWRGSLSGAHLFWRQRRQRPKGRCQIGEGEGVARQLAADHEAVGPRGRHPGRGHPGRGDRGGGGGRGAWAAAAAADAAVRSSRPQFGLQDVGAGGAGAGDGLRRLLRAQHLPRQVVGRVLHSLQPRAGQVLRRGDRVADQECLVAGELETDRFLFTEGNTITLFISLHSIDSSARNIGILLKAFCSIIVLFLM